jgi:uroporphyrinogen-III synthase
MTRPPLLILRPEPGASQTAARAIKQGWEVIVAPIFRIEPVAWDAPDPDCYDALIVTSANAVRQAGKALASYRRLPAFAVGGATAAALRDAGFADVRSGRGNAMAILTLAADAGIRRALHLAGADLSDADHPAILLDRRIVYRSVAIGEDGWREAILRDPSQPPIALLHSARAARHFATLCDHGGIARGDVRIAALAPAILAAAGDGWHAAIAAPTPDDIALLAAAARLCQ